MKRISYENVSSPAITVQLDSSALQQSRLNTSVGYDLMSQDAFDSVLDAKINNYSQLYLTDKRKLSELFKIEEKNDLNPPLYGAPALPENYQLDTTLFSQYTQKYIKRTTIGNIEFKWSEVDEEISENFFFTIEFLDSRRCQIYFLYDFERNYLKRGQITNDQFEFTYVDSLNIDEYCIFDYIWDKTQGIIVLTFNNNGRKVLSFLDSTTVIVTQETSLQSNTPYTTDNFLTVKIPFGTEQLSISNNWIVYKNEINSNMDVDTNRTITDVQMNYLISGQYSKTNDTFDISILQLKNFLNRSYNQARGQCVYSGENADINYRTYTTLLTGQKGELGFDDIIMNYKTFFKDLSINPDTIVEFTLPSSIEPYSRLNINDTAFIECGALYGQTPMQQDRIYKMLDGRERYLPDTIGSGLENRGVYLCTWLYKNGDGDPIWLDRYFNSSITSAQQALTKSLAGGTIISYQGNYQGQNYDAYTMLREKGYFDKRSDLTLEPNMTYKYSRLGPDYFQKYQNSYSSNKKYQQNEIVLDGNTIENIKSNIIGSPIRNLTIDFFMKMSDFTKASGRTIFSCMNSTGFQLYNNPLISDVIISQSSTSIKLLNNELDVIREITQNDIDVENILFVHSNGIDSDMLVFDSLGKIKKVTFDGLVIAQNAYDQNNTIRQSYYEFDKDSNKDYVLIYTDDYIYTIDVATLQIQKQNQAQIQILGVYTYKNSNKLYHYKNTATNTEYLEFNTIEIFRQKQGTKIKNVQTDPDNNLIIVINDNILVFDSNTRLIQRTKLSDYEIISIEQIRQSTGEKQIVQSVQGAENKIVIFDYNFTIVTEKLQDDNLIKSPLSTINSMMNYFGLSENNRLFFDIDIPLNEYNKKLVRGKREVDISNFGDSEHQITITLDSEHLAVYIFVNGIETAKIPFLDTTSSIIELPQGLQNDIVVGTSYFFQNQLRRQQVFDKIQYMDKTSLYNFSIFNSCMSTSDLNILRRQRYGVSNLMLSIPCGYANEFDTIQTIFKTSIPQRKSNRMDIVIDGLIVDGENLLEHHDDLEQLINDILLNETSITSEKNVIFD